MTKKECEAAISKWEIEAKPYNGGGGHFVWMGDHARLVRAYMAAMALIQDLESKLHEDACDCRRCDLLREYHKP